MTDVAGRPVADEWLDPERIVVACGPPVVGVVVDDGSIRDEDVDARAGLDLPGDLGRDHP